MRAVHQILFSLFAALLLALPAQPGRPADNVSGVTPQAAAVRLQELRRKYGTPADHYAMIHGIQVAYRDQGSGPAILIIHGSSSNLRSFNRVAQLLARHFRVIRYDVPPFGLSGPVDQVDLSGVKPEDIPAGLLQHLGIGRANVVAYSFGGSIALSLAVSYPDMVERLVISNAPSDPVPRNFTFGPSLDAAFQKYGRLDNYLALRPPAFWMTYFRYYFGDPNRVPRNIAEQAADFTRPMPTHNLLALIATVADNTAVHARYAKVRGPVLLLWGGRDPMLPAPMATKLEGYLISAQVSKIIMPDVGHFPLMEVPDRYAQLVADFIRTATPVAPASPPPDQR